MEQQIQPQITVEIDVKEERKVHAENMRLKKQIKKLEAELIALKEFLGVKNEPSK